jgi:hypothetical protein
VVPKPWLESQGGVYSQIIEFVLKDMMAQETRPMKPKGFFLKINKASW